MLNREQIVKQLTTFARDNGHALEELVVTHGAACVLLGIKDTTNDIDVTTSLSVWSHHIKLGQKPEEIGDGVMLLSATDTIDLHVGAPCPKYSNFDCEEGIYYHGFHQTLEDYRHLNRDKDKDIILQLESLTELPW